MTQKEDLLDALRAGIPAFAQKFKLDRGQRKSMENLLKPHTLLIGFAPALRAPTNGPPCSLPTRTGWRAS